MATIDDESAGLRAAITSGGRKVVTQTGGVRKEVEYPSFADMKARLDWLERQQSGGSRTRVTLASF